MTRVGLKNLYRNRSSDLSHKNVFFVYFFHVLVIIINYKSIERLNPKKSSCDSHFKIGQCITMEMALQNHIITCIHS